MQNKFKASVTSVLMLGLVSFAFNVVTPFTSAHAEQGANSEQHEQQKTQKKPFHY